MASLNYGERIYVSTAPPGIIVGVFVRVHES